MSTWIERVSQSFSSLGELETVLGGMTITWVTAGLTATVLGWVLRREVVRRTRCVAALPPPSFPAPQPKIVLQLPKREWRP